jgi:hypothetical protein
LLAPSLFCCELALNLAAHWPREFWRSGWNLFDLFVVVVSLSSYMTTAELPGVAMVRRRQMARSVCFLLYLVSGHVVFGIKASAFLSERNA